MSTPQPEADAEYSRGEGGSRGVRGSLTGRGTARLPEAARPRIRWVAGLGSVACLLLVAAEFLPLYGVQPTSGGPVLRSVSAGSHHGFALALLAVVAAWLCWLLGSARLRIALPGLALLGLAALVVALAADLPSAQASGLLAAPAGAPASGPAFQLGSATPRAGMYVETLGAILLLAAGAGGLLLFTPPRARRMSSR